ncbi:DUF2523 family protein [Luteibacter sp. 22Crub2.1]|uniref:DUF2523 family protein n=1 Tax=Luteibacter sp. 22Crub2.1 TaxID=1283288 RepID=UPI0009A6012C|nr:DUF2523 family protein [Luteibacter sp. 22Crub2.1]SKB73716.1 Protein of unknown function [Luteibacter sp. 22Crub2.1]
MPPFLLPLIEVVGSALSRLIFSRVGQWVLTGMLFLGIKFTAQKVVTEPLIAAIQQHVSGLGGGIIAWLAYLNVDVAITIVLSAYASASGTKMVLSRIGKTA